MLLASELNTRMKELLHGDDRWISGPAAALTEPPVIVGAIDSPEEEAEIDAVNAWCEEQGLPKGIVSYELVDGAGELIAMIDLAWPSGVQLELSQPVALLLEESPSTVAAASQAGYRCFTTTSALKQYVESEVLAVG
jgi:hypothetical protein